MENRYSRFLIYNVVILIVFGTLGCTAEDEKLQEKRIGIVKIIQIDKKNALDLYNRNGSISISKSTNSAITIRAYKRTYNNYREMEKVEISVMSEGDKIIIKSIDLNKSLGVAVDYEILIPDNIRLDKVENANGKVVIKNILGNGKINNSNGEIVISNVMGYITAKTSNGKIELMNIIGVEKAETSNGNINIEIEEVTNANTEIKTSHGSVKLKIKKEIDADVEMKTTNGFLYIREIEVNILNLTKNYLKGKIGKGGKKIYIETSNGDIDIYK